jgi:hypothetical protein
LSSWCAVWCGCAVAMAHVDGFRRQCVHARVVPTHLPTDTRKHLRKQHHANRRGRSTTRSCSG